MSSNKTAYLDAKGEKLRVADSEIPKPGYNEIIVKNKAVAINPVDWRIQDTGMFVQKYPIVLGEDVAGEVHEVGKSVKHFKKSDRVLAHGISLVSGKEGDGGFQLYSAVPAAKVSLIPANVTFAEASVVPLAFDTAAVGLYTSEPKGMLDLPLPSHDPQPANKTIFVWGGSSSVGAFVIQLAVASGVKVVTVSSRHNYEFCKKCGASEVIDYRSPSVIDEVVSAVKNLGGDFAGTYDAISTADSYRPGLAITEKLGGGNYATVLPGPESVPESIKLGNIFGVSDATHQLWRDFVPKALESGQLKCLPEPLVIGKGLESVQRGLDENKKGVSARKVVVEL